jgi:hypothetical protein
MEVEEIMQKLLDPLFMLLLFVHPSLLLANAWL